MIFPQATTPCSRVLAGEAVQKAEDGGRRMTAVAATPSLAGGVAAWTEKREAERSLTGSQRCTPDRERCSNVQAAQPEPRGPGCTFGGSSGNPCPPSRTRCHQGQTEARWGRLPLPVQLQQRSGGTRSQSAVQLQPTCVQDHPNWTLNTYHFQI